MPLYLLPVGHDAIPYQLSCVFPLRLDAFVLDSFDALLLQQYISVDSVL
jgi:hypothetical protein